MDWTVPANTPTSPTGSPSSPRSGRSSSAPYEESLAIKRRLGDSRGIAIRLRNLGTVALAQGASERALDLGEEALALLRDLGDKDVTAAVDTMARAALPTASPPSLACAMPVKAGGIPAR